MSRTETLTQIVRDVIEGHGGFDAFAHNCHAASLAVVRSGRLPEGSRVARGTCRGVLGQHSWIVVPAETRQGYVPLVYDPSATVLDPTLWSYDETADRVMVADNDLTRRRPHGVGSIWDSPLPRSFGGEPIIPDGLTPYASSFLDLCSATVGALDIRFWIVLLNGPMEGWPASEVVAAAYADKRLSALIPIDIVGMLTDINPGGLYLPGRERSEV